jgi:hypothetical protein
MKKFQLVPIVALAALSFGFKAGEILQLSDYLNAHRTSNVRKDAHNVIFALAPKTTGKIVQLKKLRKGNYAIELSLHDGAHSGKKVWVYYDSARPRLKLYQGESVKGASEVQEPETAKSGMTTEEQEAVHTPEQQQELQEPPVTQATEAPDYGKELDAVQKGTAEMGSSSPFCTDSTLSTPQAGSPTESSEYPESISAAPKTDSYTGGLTKPMGHMRPEGYTAWIEPSGEISQFSFTNYGGNSIVPGNPNDNIFEGHRRFEFVMPGRARQEMMFHVSDSPKGAPGGKRGYRESYFAVFPRRVVPSIKVKEGVYEVILPTGEQVRFKADTHEIVGGVLSEGPMTSGNAAVKYSGNGVIIRTDAINDDPRTEARTATISKPQSKQSCQVPVSKLWTTDANHPRFRFPTDEEFDRFVRAKCGFGI